MTSLLPLVREIAFVHLQRCADLVLPIIAVAAVIAMWFVVWLQHGSTLAWLGGFSAISGFTVYASVLRQDTSEGYPVKRGYVAIEGLVASICSICLWAGVFAPLDAPPLLFTLPIVLYYVVQNLMHCIIGQVDPTLRKEDPNQLLKQDPFHCALLSFRPAPKCTISNGVGCLVVVRTGR